MNTPSRRGQGLTEYIILVALLAIGCISIVTYFGDELRDLFGRSADALAGDTNVVRGPRGSGDEKKNLTNFAQADDQGCSGGVCRY
ncbi:MAG: hypothetical protein JNM17_37870 [Archangium sp.]|nr:hypothetical protein [Archangium sp.]